MKSIRYVSPPFASEGAALASVETIMAEGGGKKKKRRITHKNAYEADGIWVAEIAVEEEEEPDKEHEPEVQPERPKENIGVDESDLYVMMHPVVERPIEIEPPKVQDVVPEHESFDITISHAPEPHVELGLDFDAAETEQGFIPLLRDEVIAPALQEQLAHEARIAQEYTALRHKIRMEELATLQPRPDNDGLKPEPAVAA